MLLAVALVLIPVRQTPEQTMSFVLAYQSGALDQKGIERLRQCQTFEQVRPSLQTLGLEAQLFEKETAFLFPSLEKLDNYIVQKRKVMDFYLSENAGARSKPWDHVVLSGALPEFCFNIYKSTLTTSFNTKPSKNNPIIPNLACKLNFVDGERDITVAISMNREVSKGLSEKIRGLAPTEGGVKPEERDLPKTLDEGIAKNPFVGYTLNGLTLSTWGKPVVNSKASRLVENYFKQLRIRTETSEEKLRSMYRDFLGQLAGQDKLWKELSTLKDRPGSAMSDELRTLVYQAVMDGGQAGFATPKSVMDFLKTAKVNKVYADMSIVGPVLNAEGSLNMVGFVF
jgi:hypothetical protein